MVKRGVDQSRLNITPHALAPTIIQQWHASGQPDIDVFIRSRTDIPTAELAELIQLDQERRWHDGNAISAEKYFEWFPVLSSCPEHQLDIAYTEFLLRESTASVGDIEQFVTRFPALAHDLRRQIEFHTAIQEMPQSFSGEDENRPLPQIPGYDVIEEIGRGGMGLIYKARQQELNRLVAIKMMIAGVWSGPEHLRRFRAEAEAIARLQHPGIVQIFEVGQVDGHPFLVLEYVAGCSLADRLSGDAWPARAAAMLIEEIASSVQFAHERGIVHRDLKPANILLSEQGVLGSPRFRSPNADPDADADRDANARGEQPKISDFGLAKLLADEPSASHAATRAGDILGTPYYMAPEQADGDLHAVGPSSDVYSIGAILYELLTGQPPFRGGTTLEILRRVVHDIPVSPSRIIRGIPPDLTTICLKCLNKLPSHRYATARSLAEDLSRFLADRPIHARRSGPLERGWRWCRRNRVVSALLLTAALLLVSLLIAVPIIRVIGHERDRAITAERATSQSRDRAVAAEKEVRLREHLARATAIQMSGRAGRRFEALREITFALDLEPDADLRRELRDEAMAALCLTDVRVVSEKPVPNAVGLQFDASLQQMAYSTSNDFSVTVRRVSDNTELLHVPPIALSVWHTACAFSPDGRFLLIAYWTREQADSLLYVWDLPSGTVIHERWIRSELVLAGAAFHPNNRWLLYCVPDVGLVVHDLIDREDVFSIPTTMQPYNICLSADGQRAAVNESSLSQQPRLAIFDLVEQKELRSWAEYAGIFAIAWSPDGKLLASATNDGRVFVWHAERENAVVQLTGHPGAVTRLEFSPNGDLLATAGWYGDTRLWAPTTGRQLLSIPGAFTRFSADGSRLGFVRGDTAGIWQLAHADYRRTIQAAGLVPQTRRLTEFSLAHCEFALQGRVLMTAGAEGVRFWNTATGEHLGLLEAGSCSRLLMHPQDKYLLTRGEAGLIRWDFVVARLNDTVTLQVQSPVMLRDSENPSTFLEMAWMPQCDSIAIDCPQTSEVQIIRTEGDTAGSVLRRLVSSYRRMTGVSVSPDGHFLATGHWKESGSQLWDLRMDQPPLLLRLPETSGDVLENVGFSPDGRWLTSDIRDGSGRPLGYAFREPGASAVSHLLPVDDTSVSAIAFSTNGQRAALSVSDQRISLIDTSDLRELVQLSSSPTNSVRPVALAPSSELLAALSYPDTVVLWNLRRLREGLRNLNLDWDDDIRLPMTDADGPILVSIDRSDIAAQIAERVAEGEKRARADELVVRAAQFETEENWHEALQALEEAVNAAPGHALAANNLAWLLSTCPDVALRDPARALQLAQAAVKLAPEDAYYRNTLGVACYRHENYSDAITELLRAEELRPDSNFAWNAFFIAMSHWQTGERVKAHDWQDRAEAWLDNRPAVSPKESSELQRLRAEAASLLQSPP